MTSDVYLSAGCGTFTGILLLASGVAKLNDLNRFQQVIRGFQLLPDGTAPVLGIAIPWCECLLGVTLLQGVLLQQPAMSRAGVGAMFLFSVFAAAIAINLLRGRRKISCGCFGSDSDTGISWMQVGRNGLFVLTAAAGAGMFNSPLPAPTLSGWRRMDAALVGLAALMSWQLLDQFFKLRLYTRLHSQFYPSASGGI